MKSPSGWLNEEYVCVGGHLFRDGKCVEGISDHQANEGEYTGVFWFTFSDGRETKRYTQKTAPQWLLKLYRQIVEAR